jgi:hypothetical protein
MIRDPQFAYRDLAGPQVLMELDSGHGRWTAETTVAAAKTARPPSSLPWRAVAAPMPEEGPVPVHTDGSCFTVLLRRSVP